MSARSVKRVPRLGTTAAGVFGRVAVAVVGLISFVGTVTPRLGGGGRAAGLRSAGMLLAVLSAFLLLGRLSGELGSGGTPIAEPAASRARMSLSILFVLLVSDEATSLDGLPGDLGGPPPSQRMRRANASWSVSYMARVSEARG